MRGRTETDELELVNHLGIDLGKDPEEILRRVEDCSFDRDAIRDAGRASDDGYPQVVRDVDANTPSRYNADPRALDPTNSFNPGIGKTTRHRDWATET